MCLNVERRQFLWGAVCVLAAMGMPASLYAQPQADKLPQRNLLVQWRVVASGQWQRSSQGVRDGAVVIDSRHGVSGKATVTWSSQLLNDEHHHDGQVLVLNGAKARLQLSLQKPELQWQWWCPPPDCTHPSQGTVVAATTWVERGSGLWVSPRWPGGQAPVALSFRADVPGQWGGVGNSRYEPDGQDAAQTQVESTLAVPLDTWVVVAQSDGQDDRQARSSAGLYSTDSSSQNQLLLQVRVRLP